MAFDVSSIGSPVDERYAQDLAVRSIEGLQGLLPTWVPRNAAPEVALIEANALTVAEVSNVANETVAAVVEILLADFYGVPRRPGAAAVGSLLLTFDSAVTTTIPAGMGFLLADYGVEVATTVDTPVSAASSAVVQVASVTATSLINGVGPGAGIDVLDLIPNLLSVAVAEGVSGPSVFSGGADPESDAEYIVRARNVCRMKTSSLGNADSFEGFVLLDGRASNAVGVMSWDGTGSPPSSPLGGDDGGHVAVVTYGRGGNLSAGVRAELEAAMTPLCVAGVTVHVLPAVLVPVNVTATVKGRPGYAADAVKAAAEAGVRALLAPERWVFGADVATGAVEAAMSDTPEVDYVDSMTVPAAAVSIPADGAPVPGTITISVI